MIVSCPECSTRFQTSEDAISLNGRMVRCSSCRSTWFVKPDPDILDLAISKENSKPAPKPAPLDANSTVESSGIAGASAASAIRVKAQQKRVFRRVFNVGMMWVSVLSIFALAAGLSYVFRQSIVDKFPRSATLYKGFNIDVAAGGLIFDDVIMRSVYVEDVLTVLIEGQVRNPDRKPHRARTVLLSLHDTNGQELAQWQAALSQEMVEKGSSIPFISQYENPPIDATRLRYRFEGDMALDATIEDSSEVSAGNDQNLRLTKTP